MRTSRCSDVRLSKTSYSNAVERAATDTTCHGVQNRGPKAVQISTEVASACSLNTVTATSPSGVGVSVFLWGGE